MLAEAMLAGPRLARLLDQRIERANVRLEARIEQAFADAEGGDDRAARAPARSTSRSSSIARLASIASASRSDRPRKANGSSVLEQLPKFARRAGFIRYWWVIGSGKSVASMSIRASARHVPPTM